MNFLITNDDGWGFDGIQTLEEVAREFGNVWVVAPMHPMSGISHQMTFESEMEFVEREPNSFALEGTPADCIRVGVTQLDVAFDWVLSGINKGANLGTDQYVSGTVAAAREASLHRIKAVAISQHLHKFALPYDWSRARTQARRVLEKVLELDCKPGNWINVNLPDVGADKISAVPICETQSDPNPLPCEFRRTDEGKLLYHGAYRDRKREPNHDIQLCFDGYITITKHKSSGVT